MYLVLSLKSCATALPDQDKSFSIYCDALCQGVGYVLMQEAKVLIKVVKEKS